MNLSDVSIRRPVLATVFALVIVLFGILGFFQLGVREYPAVDPPVVTVRTEYRGANPSIIDSQITEPLEQSISGIAGIRTVSSTSREGRSEIRVEFTLNTDIEAAANDVRDKVSQAVRRLPADADPPAVEKADADSDPIIFLALQSRTRDILEVSNIADTVLKERFQTIPGVSSVRIFGERRYAMRIWLDPEKMAAHSITPQDVFDAVGRQNVDLPSGTIEGTTTELSIRTDSRLSTPEDFNNLIVRKDSNRQILLRDVGFAELSAEDLRRGNVSRGIGMIGIAVIPQPNTNAIAIADEFYRRYEQVKRELPSDFEMELGYDFTRFVRSSISEVQSTLLIAFGLVAFIIFVFLRDWRSVLIPVITIPICIISGFFVMFMAGYSINVLTLVALVLAIGLVCDDAIVVLENVYTKIEEGHTPFHAAVKGVHEIYFAVISTTISLVAVFVPIIFLQGLTGRLFREFGVTLVGCVICSSFLALTLTPMMCRFLLKPKGQGHGLIFRVTEPFFEAMNNAYRWSLGLVLKFPVICLPVLAIAIFAIIWAGNNLQSELAPMEDRSNLRLNIRAAEGATYDYTSSNIRQLAAELEEKYDEDLHRIFAIAGNGGPNTGFINIYLKEPLQRQRTAFEVFAELSRDAQGVTAFRATPTMPPTIGDRRSGQPLQYVLQAPSLDRMVEILPKFLEEANRHPALRFVDSDLKTNRPQANIEIDRARAAELGVDVTEIARAIQLAFGETRFDYFIKNSRQYQVIGQLERPNRSRPLDLERLHVRARTGEMIPLSSFVTVSETVSPAAIFRYDRFISATVSGGLAPGFTLGDGIAAMDEIAAKVLPDDFSTALSGQSRDFQESSSSLLFAFLVAIVLIYLVLAAQFESWVDPFIILLTVPLSLSGALLSLWYMEQTLNVFSQIGIIMLIGLVTKNGILIVEFANQRKRAGMSVKEAVHDAAAARFRPILMTSLSTILGILPIAMAMGGAAGSRRSMGIAVVGGLTLASVLTLYVVPTVYAFLSSAYKERTDEQESDELNPTPNMAAANS